MSFSSLPRIDSFLRGFAASLGWNEASINRLRSAGEETLSSLLSQDEEPEEDASKRLIVAARRADAAIEMEFAVTTEGGNLEDKLAYLNEQPEIQDEREISFRLLHHYASSIQHHKYHDIDIYYGASRPFSIVPKRWASRPVRFNSPIRSGRGCPQVQQGTAMRRPLIED